MAGDAIHVRTIGLGQLLRAFRSLGPAASRDIRSELRQAADPIRAGAAARAPHRTGDLAASLRIGVTARGISIYSRDPGAGVVYYGGTISPRGVPIHFRRTEFIAREVDEHSDELVDNLGDAVVRAARSVGWH